jgi:hypothetical protein
MIGLLANRGSRFSDIELDGSATSKRTGGGKGSSGHTPAVSSPNSGAGFARTAGRDGGQGGPIFDDQEEIGVDRRGKRTPSEG